MREAALPLPVRIELMAGVKVSQRDQLKRALVALPVIVPTDETWALVEQWTETASKAGLHFGLTDLVIAPLADEVDALVWSLDSDFQRLEDLNLVRLYA